MGPFDLLGSRLRLERDLREDRTRGGESPLDVGELGCGVAHAVSDVAHLALEARALLSDLLEPSLALEDLPSQIGLLCRGARRHYGYENACEGDIRQEARRH